MTIKDLDDPNKEVVDPNEGDKIFRNLIKRLIYGLTVMHIRPEEIVIMKAEQILNEDNDETQWFEEKAKFYIILNGTYKVSSLRFNKRKNNENDPKEDDQYDQVAR